MVPYLLTAWALDQSDHFDYTIPALNKLSDIQLAELVSKIVSLRGQNREGDIKQIWDAIPLAARNLMINMWIKSNSESDTFRSDIAHPIPSVEQACDLIQLHDDLTADEISLAENVIPAAVNKEGERLFYDNTESAMAA